MPVNLAELNMLGGTFYKMDKETFLELVCVSQDFENSLEKKIPLLMNWLKVFLLATKVMMIMKNK